MPFIVWTSSEKYSKYRNYIQNNTNLKIYFCGKMKWKKKDLKLIQGQENSTQIVSISVLRVRNTLTCQSATVTSFTCPAFDYMKSGICHKAWIYAANLCLKTIVITEKFYLFFTKRCRNVLLLGVRKPALYERCVYISCLWKLPRVLLLVIISHAWFFQYFLA